jgi:putative salt-induced outer membrane protein YdiY
MCSFVNPRKKRHSLLVHERWCMNTKIYTKYNPQVFLLKIVGRSLSVSSLKWFFSLLLLMSSTAAPAIVSMESVHLGKPPQGFSGQFDLSVDADYGNTEAADASTGLKLQWSEDHNIDFVLANYAYGESAGTRNKNNAFIHVRHIHQRSAHIAWEAFSQLSNNEFTRLNVRALIGGGVRLTLGELTAERAMYLGLGGFYEREQLDIDSTNNIEQTNETVRGNIYLVMKYQFNSHVSLVSSTYYQPAVDEVSDYRAIEDASIVSKLTDGLSLRMGVNVQHDSRPPPEVKKTDSSINVGLSVNF